MTKTAAWVTVDLLGLGKIKVNFRKRGSVLNFYSFNPSVRIPDV